MIPTFDEFMASLPIEYHTDAIREKVKLAYDREVANMKEYASRAQQPEMCLSLFRDTGSYQIIAEGYVFDRGKSYDPGKWNWHLVNDSQSLYGFGMVLDKERLEVSCHH